MSSGKRYDTSEPLTEHDIAARLDKAVERVVRIMWDARQLGLALQIHHSRYLTHDALGMLRAELDAWDVEPNPLPMQLDPLSPDAQAVADAYSRWLSNFTPTGALMSEQQGTEQQPEQTSTTTEGGAQPATPDINVHAGGDATVDASAAAPTDEGDDNAADGDGQE